MPWEWNEYSLAPIKKNILSRTTSKYLFNSLFGGPGNRVFCHRETSIRSFEKVSVMFLERDG
jgi:hypothetical protein